MIELQTLLAYRMEWQLRLAERSLKPCIPICYGRALNLAASETVKKNKTLRDVLYKLFEITDEILPTS